MVLSQIIYELEVYVRHTYGARASQFEFVLCKETANILKKNYCVRSIFARSYAVDEFGNYQFNSIYWNDLTIKVYWEIYVSLEFIFAIKSHQHSQQIWYFSFIFLCIFLIYLSCWCVNKNIDILKWNFCVHRNDS